MSDAAELDPQTLLQAYAQGVFPMTDRDGSIRWYTADPRGILPLDAFHIPRTLAQVCRQRRFDIRFNHDFEGTMRACMNARRDGTWISEPLILAYLQLHRLGFAHSVEAWQSGKLVGGLYGVAMRGAFFGESMFHTERDASKVALVALVDRLKNAGYELLDAQATTAHLRRFGAIDISSADYLQRLKRALQRECFFA